MNYYKISMAKMCDPEGIEGCTADVSYITADTDETAEEFSIDQAIEYGCKFHSYKKVLLSEIPKEYDKAHIINIKL